MREQDKKVVLERVCFSKMGIAPYQRQMGISQVRRIAAEFDPLKVGIVHVNYRDGVYWIVDGRHRVEAMRRLGHQDAMCQVTRLSYTEEAHYFATQRKNTTNLYGVDLFVAAVESGEEEACAINSILTSRGVKVMRGGGSKSGFKTLQAVQALKDIYREYGGNTLGLTIDLVYATWEVSMDKQAKRAEILYGVGWFVDVANRRGIYAKKEAAECFSRKSPTQILAAARARCLHSAARDLRPSIEGVFRELWNYRKHIGSSKYINPPSLE